jgi:hypothetical protein
MLGDENGLQQETETMRFEVHRFARRFSYGSGGRSAEAGTAPSRVISRAIS